MSEQSIPVISIDGPTASGKGTVAELLAKQLHYAYLDSGAIYRVLAVAVMQKRLDPDVSIDHDEIEALAGELPVVFAQGKVLLEGENVSHAIRTEVAGAMASRLAVLPEVRSQLLQRQRDFRVAPGLVADGRDMGSVVFPDSCLKVFLTATAETRAERRFQQLTQRGADVSFEQILSDLQSRDQRDSARAVAPLKPFADSRILDCSDMAVEEVVQTIWGWYIKA